MAVTIASNRTALKVGHGSLGLMPTSWLAMSFSRSERDWNCRACAQECRHVHTSFSHGVSQTQIDWSPGRVSRRLVDWPQTAFEEITMPPESAGCDASPKATWGQRGVLLLIYKPGYAWPGLIIVLLGVPVYFVWRRIALYLGPDATPRPVPLLVPSVL